VATLVLLAVVVLGLGACGRDSAVGSGETTRRPPNILFILIDDMGFNDLGANGNPDVRTPNLDQFAAQGVRFTRNYVDSTCAATRAGVLTGTPPAARGFRPAGLGISPDIITLPEALRAAGYSTHHVGKWHLGHATSLAWPLQQGFDEFFGFLDQLLLRGPHRQGKLKWSRPTYRSPWLQEGNSGPRPFEGHLSDILLARAIDVIRSASASDQPWFLNYWMYAPHTPLEPADRFADGYPRTPRGRYLALLEQLDAAVGSLLDALAASGAGANTLVMIASDNGGTNSELNNNAPYFGDKAAFLEGGVRTPLLVRWPGVLPRGQVHPTSVSYLDYYPTLVAAAGGDLPAGLPGTDLRQRLVSAGGLERPLFWESGSSENRSWGVLSADGDWRLSQFFTGDIHLAHLARDASGEENVAARYPDVVARLSREFLSQRDRARRLSLTTGVLGENGRARLSGEDLQRAPGFGGHTFAIALEPAATAASTAGSGLQTVAFQRGQWALRQSGDRLLVEINGLTLAGPAPVAGACTAVIVTSAFDRSYLFKSANRSLIELYLDGKRVARRVVEAMPVAPRDDYLQPTYIGQDDRGGNRYRGRLGAPLILNQHIVDQPRPGADLPGSVAALSGELCDR
jgi:arylsulfatase A-like enzyme